jgi:hypothetical protein
MSWWMTDARKTWEAMPGQRLILSGGDGATLEAIQARRNYMTGALVLTAFLRVGEGEIVGKRLEDLSLQVLKGEVKVVPEDEPRVVDLGYTPLS